MIDRATFMATMISLATAAFGFVAALAWNEFITALVRSVMGEQGGLLGLLLYAVVVTVLAVLVIAWLGRISERTGARSKL